MEKKVTRAGSPLKTAAGVIVVPVTEVSIAGHSCGNGVAFFCHARVLSVVVTSPSGQRAISADGQEVSLALLMEEVSGLRETLERI